MATRLVTETLDPIAAAVARAFARAGQLNLAGIAAEARIADAIEIVRTDSVRLAASRARSALRAISPGPAAMAAARRRSGLSTGAQR